MGKRHFSCAPGVLRRSISKALLPIALAALAGCREAAAPTDPGPDDGQGPGLAVALASVPSQFRETILTGSLAYPTAMAIAPDGRVFVCEQGGKLRVVKNGALLSAYFLNLSVSSGGERGLLGIAFDPQFASNRWIYVYYTTATSPVHNRVSRFTASVSNPDVAESGSEVFLLELNNLSAGNHNGGALHFGPDGKLYIAVGENAVPSNAQSLGNLLGKMLRINKDGSIPSDNPFYGSATGNNRAIWALGLRNPFTFNFQPGTGRIFINDVGQDAWEEIDEGAAGANFGWPATEGATADPRFRTPFHTYANKGSNCAIVGAAFYNPASATFPTDYHGDYFYGDYCGGWIRRIDLSTRSVSDFATGISGLVDVQVGDDGALYYLSAGSGRLARVTYSGGGGQAPAITTHPANATVSTGGSATFTVAASGSAPLSYRWQRNGADISGATSSSYALSNAQSGDNGARFRAIATNSLGSATSNEATLTVTSNRAPTGTFTAPASGTLYSGGQVISYSGTGTDPDQGDLPASSFTWHVDFHHDTHTHPYVLPTTGSKTGSFTAFTEGETSSNVFYRLHLTVTDAQGATHRTSVDILPRTVQVTLATQPAGLAVQLDGSPFASPYTFTGVVGVRRNISVSSPQSSGGTSYAFQSWSDGGAMSHAVSTPASATTYIAAFAAGSGGGPNTTPRGTMTSPMAGTQYTPGASIAYSGTATDAQEGSLGPSAFTWWVEIVHGAHTHPVQGPVPGVMSGSFTPSTTEQVNHSTGQPDLNYFYRISMRVTDAGGLTHWTYRDIQRKP